MNNNCVVIGFILLFVTVLVYCSCGKKSAGIPWSGAHYSSYITTNGHHLYMVPMTRGGTAGDSIYVYDSNWKQGWTFISDRENEGPYISKSRGFTWVLTYHGDNISIERVPNNRDVQPEYYLLGTKIPNESKTRSYAGSFTVTNRNIGGPVVEGTLPPGVLGNVEIQPTGKDFWVSGFEGVDGPGGLALFSKELDNGYNAYTFSGVLKGGVVAKIIFYDGVNFQMLVSTKTGVVALNGTRDTFK